MLRIPILRSEILTWPVMCLSRGTADEEPLVDGAVNLLRGELLVGRELRQLVGADTAGRLADGGVGAGKVSAE